MDFIISREPKDQNDLEQTDMLTNPISFGGRFQDGDYYPRTAPICICIIVVEKL